MCPECDGFQVGLRSITKEGREQGKRFGVEQYEMRTFSKDQEKLENLVTQYNTITLYSILLALSFQICIYLAFHVLPMSYDYVFYVI